VDMLTVEIWNINNFAEKEEHKLGEVIVLLIHLRFNDPASDFGIKQVARFNCSLLQRVFMSELNIPS